jgi:prepilin-type processing-associated H-X9-DG protein
MEQDGVASGPRFTWIALLVVVVIICVLIALLLPSVECARETARRCQCNNQLKQIGLGLHNYHNVHKTFPPGATVSPANIAADAANPWADAKLTTKGADGTSWILRLLPYIEADSKYKAWDFEYGVSGGTNPSIASSDIKGLYCPTRRSKIREGVDSRMMLNTKWTGGGTDYGGCVGRYQGFLPDADQSMTVPDAKDRLKLAFVPGVDVADIGLMVAGDNSGPDATCLADKGFGIFGRVNVGTTIAEVQKDGCSNTIMTGELQRITQKTTAGPFNANSGPVFSHDGWAIGGSPTLFTTGCPYPTDVKTNSLMSNGYFMSPGSEHSGGANFGIADGSVRFIATSINNNIVALIGSMDDRIPILSGEEG